MLRSKSGTSLSIVLLWGYGVAEWHYASEDIPEFVSSIRSRCDVVAVAVDVCWRRF
jgi:hypothetical protein